MSALLRTAPLLLRRRGAIADLLPIIAFAASAGIMATVLGGVSAFFRRASEAGAYGPQPISNEASSLSFLMICAIIAAALLLPSAIGIGGSAARLSLVRRERDLAAMRLVGGTTSQVGLVAVLDVAVQAVIGTVLGVLLHLAVTPVFTTLDFGFAPFGYGELLLPWWGYPVLVLGMLVLALGSAALALTGIALSPLGVARSSRTTRMSVVRVLVWVALLVVFVIAAQVMSAIAQMAGIGVLIGFMAVMMALIVGGINVIGPFIVWVVARMIAAVAPTPALLVGARRLAADPRSGWRAVSGITFALVIAGFLTLISTLGGPSGSADAMIFTGLGTGGLLTLAIAGVLAAVATGVTQTARVIDQAPVLRSQHVAGAEVSQLHRARLAEIGVPLVLSSLIAAVTSLVLLAPASGALGSSLMPVLQFAGAVIAAYALVILAVLIASPLVRRAALTGR